MNKHNLSIKKLKKQFLSLNDSIESYFDKLKFFINNIKKSKLSHYNRFFLVTAIPIFFVVIYFLIPTFFNKDIIQMDIENQIMKKYNIDIDFNEKIKYRLLPKPHYLAKNLSILNDQKEIAISKNFQINIASSKFLSLNKKVEIRDLIFKNIDFKIDLKDFAFFLKLLETEPNENNIIFKNGNIFLKNNDEDILFINKIKKSKFHYDAKNMVNILSFNNEIFNVPFKFIIKKDKFNKKIYTKFNSKKIRLNVDNEINYDKKNKDGLVDILFVNKSTSFRYEIKKNSFNFNSEDNVNNYKGIIDFKPFYFSASFNYEGLSTKNLFTENSIFIDLIKSNFLSNKNINAILDVKVKDITDINELNNLFLKIGIEEGNIGFSNSSMMWRENLKITLSESLLNNESDDITLIGTAVLNFKNLDNFYKSFQIQKIHRKNIKEVQIDFIYNFNDKKFTFDNVKIDKSQNSNLEKYINQFNSSENRVFNKVRFKNFVSNFFAAYSG